MVKNFGMSAAKAPRARVPNLKKVQTKPTTPTISAADEGERWALMPNTALAAGGVKTRGPGQKRIKVGIGNGPGFTDKNT